MAWVQQPHVNVSFRPAKPIGEQALAEGQEWHTAGTFSAQVLQIWDPLSWDSEDVAFRSLNLAPKAVSAFGKKSPFCVRPWSCLSLLPAFTQGQGTLCDLVLRGPLLPPASPALSIPPLGPVPAPGRGQPLPAHRLLPVLSTTGRLKSWHFLASFKSCFICVSVSGISALRPCYVPYTRPKTCT